MADKKITQLTDLGTTLQSADLFHVIDDPAGTPINKKVTAANVFNNIPTWLGLKQASQTLTADGSTTLVANVTAPVTEINATSAGSSVTLAAGSEGQIKMIFNSSTSGTNDIVITPSSFKGGTTITLSAPGDTCTLIYKSSSWYVIGGNNFVIA